MREPLVLAEAIARRVSAIVEATIILVAVL